MRYTTKTLFQKKDKSQQHEGDISPFQAVCTALAATVGTGNIVGVALAIATGGPGAMFWLWLSALVGMVIKYCEVTLSVAYRTTNEKGELVGGPMYYITRGLGPQVAGRSVRALRLYRLLRHRRQRPGQLPGSGVNSSFGIPPCGPSASWWLCWPPWWSSAALPASPA